MNVLSVQLEEALLSNVIFIRLGVHDNSSRTGCKDDLEK